MFTHDTSLSIKQSTGEKEYNMVSDDGVFSPNPVPTSPHIKSLARNTYRPKIGSPLRSQIASQSCTELSASNSSFTQTTPNPTKLPSIHVITQAVGVGNIHQPSIPSTSNYSSSAIYPVKETSTNVVPPFFIELCSLAANDNVSESVEFKNQTQLPVDTSKPPQFPRIPIQKLVNEEDSTNCKLTQLLSSSISVKYPNNDTSVGTKADSTQEIDKNNLCGVSNDKSDGTVPPHANEVANKYPQNHYEPTTKESCSELAKCLRYSHHHLTIEELYGWICSLKNGRAEAKSPSDKVGVLERKAPSLYRALIKTCQASFERRQNDPTKYPGILQSSRLHFNLLERSCLAIKIILASSDRVGSPPKLFYTPIPRNAFYKVYFITCQRLLRESCGANYSSYSQPLLLGHSQFGKLIKLVYPDVVIKKRGKRGDSKVHYINLTWNNDIVDEAFQRLVSLTMVEVEKLFEDPPENRLHTFKEQRLNNVTSNRSFNHSEPSFFMGFGPHTIRLPHTFADLSQGYPKTDFSPRIWNLVPGEVPKQSAWANHNIAISLNALQRYNVDFRGIKESIDSSGNLDQDRCSFMQTVVDTIIQLMKQDAPEHVFMHLYLAILLSLFPLMISSDEEVPVMTKTILRNSIMGCVTRLETDMPNFVEFDRKSMSIFVQMLSNMASLSEMSSHRSQVPYSKSFINEMARDLSSTATSNVEPSQDMLSLEDTYIQGVLGAIGSFHFGKVPQSLPTDAVGTIHQLAKFVAKTVTVFEEKFLAIRSRAREGNREDTATDLSFQLFRVAVQYVHDHVLTETFAQRFPIPIASLIINHISTSMNCTSYQDVEDPETDLSRDLLRTRCVFSKMFRKYISILSEVAALSQILAQSSSKKSECT